MIAKKFNATITQGVLGRLTMRIWMNAKDRRDFILEKGIQPAGLFEIVVMDTTKENQSDMEKELKIKLITKEV